VCVQIEFAARAAHNEMRVNDIDRV
jgi:hypothetical protein